MAQSRTAGSPAAVGLAPRGTLTQAAFEQLITHVINGRWGAGDRIPPERELCEQLGIARSSLREALKALEFIGILESRVGEGTFVCPRSEFLCRPLLWAFTGTDDEQLREITEARGVLEETLAALAAERATDAQIQQVGGSVRQMQDDLAHGRLMLDSDLAFHDALGEAAHNVVLSNAAHLLRNMLRQWIYLKLLLPGVSGSAFDQHAEILEMLQKRDPDAARMSMRSHVKSSSELVIQIVQQQHSSAEIQPMSRRQSGHTPDEPRKTRG
jgi:GntR family transcriptional repressor for pyruvate dehydrogenase complex